MPQDNTGASLDGQLELKKRARRRLVGAAALALLAAVVLPMVMDHEPRQPAQDVQITIPSRDDQGLAARVLTGKPAATPLPPAASAKPEATHESKADVRSDVRPETRPDAKAEEARPAETRPAEPKAETRPAPTPAPVADESWVVQLGAYKEEGRVKLLLSKLTQLGFPVFTENVDTPQGARTRVRAGPFKTREAAEKARERIGKIGVDGPVARK